MLKSYKILEEQIANNAKELKELYSTGRPGYLSPGNSVSGTVQQKKGKTGRPKRLRVCETIRKTGPVEGLVIGSRGDLIPRMENPGHTVTAVRCYRCGIHFPVADFIYTKKSGLCIDCWEEMVL